MQRSRPNRPVSPLLPPVLSLLCLLAVVLSLPAMAAARPLFVVTIHPLKAILQEVCGKSAEVRLLLPPGASPHTFEPRPSDVRELERALAFFYVGPGLDREWAVTLPAAASVEMLDLVPPTMQRTMELHKHGGEEHHGENATEHTTGGHLEDDKKPKVIDPHFWTDPLTVKTTLPFLTSELCGLDPDGCTAYQKNARAFAGRLDRLHAELDHTLKFIRSKPILLFHPSFNYLIGRYRLRLVGVIEEFPGREPTPRFLQKTVEMIDRLRVKALFTEPQLPQRPARVLAETAGVALYELDPLGGTEGRITYEELMRYNARTLSDALR